MPSDSDHKLSSRLTWLCAAVLFCAGCASTGGDGGDGQDGVAEQARRTKLAKRINACAIQRARFDRAQGQLHQFDRVIRAIEVAKSSQTDQRLHRRHGWRDSWESTSIEGLEVSADVEGLRISGRAQSWRDLAEFLARVSDASRIDFGVAEASKDEDDAITFRLEPTEALASPLRGVEFGPELFPAKKARPLDEYADSLCDFGGDSPPQAQSETNATQFEALGASRVGDWQRTTLRATLADDADLNYVMRQVADYHGLSARLGGEQLVVDFYQLELSEEFDAATWLAKLAESARAELVGLGEAPEESGLITWEEKDGLPEGVSRSLLANMSWYRYERIRTLYYEIAGRYDRMVLADTLRERNARALRASLCLTRAYTQPLETAPDDQTRPLQTAMLTFHAPVDGDVDALDIERVRILGDGRTDWTLASADEATIDGVQQAFARCMGSATLDQKRSKSKETTVWSGTATASAEGLHTSMAVDVELPRFDDGRQFVLAVRRDQYGFRQDLYNLENQLVTSESYKEVGRVIPRRAQIGEVLDDLAETASGFATDITELRQQPVAAQGWKSVAPKLYGLEAAAKPADLLGFVAQVLDLDRPLVPAEFVIEPHDDGERLVLRASFYVFGSAK